MESNEYFNMDFLVDRFLGVKGQDLVTNKKFKEKAAKRKKRQQLKQEQQEQQELKEQQEVKLDLKEEKLSLRKL